MSGQGVRQEERVSTSLRFRRSTRRAVDQLAILLGGLSRDDMVQLLLRDGLALAYARMGIEEDPAVTAAKLLDVLEATWDAEMSDEELRAFAVTRIVLQRIAQITARANGEVLPHVRPPS